MRTITICLQYGSCKGNVFREHFFIQLNDADFIGSVHMNRIRTKVIQTLCEVHVQRSSEPISFSYARDVICVHCSF